MHNPKSLVVVHSSKYGIKIRNCQSTVKPTEQDLGDITNYREWKRYLRLSTDGIYGANALIDEHKACEALLLHAKELINRTNKI